MRHPPSGGRRRAARTGRGGDSRPRWGGKGPPSDQKPGRPTTFAGQLQPAAGQKIRRIRLAQNRRHAALAQGVFQSSHDLGLIAGADPDHPFSRKSQTGQAGRMQVVTAADPDYRAAAGQGRGHQGGQGGGGDRQLVFQPLSSQLMPTGQGKAALGKDGVEIGIAKRQGGSDAARRAPVENGQAGPDRRQGGGARHGSEGLRLFSFCSSPAKSGVKRRTARRVETSTGIGPGREGHL